MDVRWIEDKELWVLWEDSSFRGGVRVVVPKKTDWPYYFGGHLVVEQDKRIQNAADDPALYGACAVIAETAGRVLIDLSLASWRNVQDNSNFAFRASWGELLASEDGRRKANVQFDVYGRSFSYDVVYFPNAKVIREREDQAGLPMVPATWVQQKRGIYWGEVWPEPVLDEIAELLSVRVPEALAAYYQMK